MNAAFGLLAIRMLPVLFVVLAAIAYVFHIEGQDAYAIRNALPMLVLLGLAALTLTNDDSSWAGRGWSWPLGTLGFAVPSLGLSLYLHYGYAVDLDGMYSESVYPRELFRYLPVYTCGAGGLGFAIGWIVGRNV